MKLRKINLVIGIFVLIVLFGGVVYSYIEGWSFIDSIYFSTVTITTLGYGDFVPQTFAGKIFTIFFSLSGIVIGLYLITSLGKYLFAIELKKKSPAKCALIKHNKSFETSKFSIGQFVEWKLSKHEAFEGNIVEIGLNHLKLNITKKNNKILPKKEQKIIKIFSKGKRDDEIKI